MNGRSESVVGRAPDGIGALFVTTDSFGGYGGIAQYSTDFARALSEHRAVREVTVVQRAVPGRIVPLPPKVALVPAATASVADFAKALAVRAMRREAVHAVVCGHIHLLPFALAVSTRYRAKLVLIAHGVEVWRAPAHRSAALATRFVDGVVSVSQVTLDRIQTWAPLLRKQTWIVPCGVDLLQFTPGPPDASLVARYGLAGRRVLGTLGRLDENERWKGFDEMLGVLPRLAERCPTVSYLIMGSGNDRGRLEAKARALGLTDRVVFTGRISESEKAAHYRLLDAFVMPSRAEGFGIVFLEALACGIPVVAGKNDGSREAVRNGQLGSIVDPDDPDDIVRGVEHALSQPRGVVSEGLRYFGIEAMTRRVHGVLEDVLPDL